MTTLHIVRQSAFATNDFVQCIQVLNNTDFIVFTDEGCYNLNHLSIKQISEQVTQMIVTEHAQARAIDLTKTKAIPIVISDLVELTFQAGRVITWQ